MIQIDLTGSRYHVEDAGHPFAGTAAAALQAAGASPAADPSCDILLLFTPPLPDESFRAGPVLDALLGRAQQMASGGRIILVVSAAGQVPLRRFPRYSAEMASLVSATRSAAMGLAPQILVNAIALGLIGDPALSGTVEMARHAALPVPQTPEAFVSALLFFAARENSYTTGQTLCVDGGWSTGYARSF